jgi:hypothetical protein
MNLVLKKSKLMAQNFSHLGAGSQQSNEFQQVQDLHCCYQSEVHKTQIKYNTVKNSPVFN